MVDGLAPSFVKIYYESIHGPHTQTVPVNLVSGGMPGGTFELYAKDNSQINWVTGITALVNAMKANFHSSVVFQYAELYSKGGTAVAPVFLDTTVLSIAGTHATASNAAGQMVFSIRSDLGGKGFLYLMDHSGGLNQKLKAPAYGGATILAVVTYLLSASNIVLCRDNGYPVVVTKVLTKTNDALRRRYRIS